MFDVYFGNENAYLIVLQNAFLTERSQFKQIYKK